MVNSKERVDRVMAAVEHTVFPESPEFNLTQPLIAAGEEYYFRSDEQVRNWVRRILAAADGVSEFTNTVHPRP